MYIIIFILGITIGSFLNVCIWRIPREESIAFPPSHCPACSTPLRWYDLVPVFSYILLKGKCRYCGEKISPQYPIIELLNGIIYVIAFYFLRLSAEFVFLCIISSILLVISVIDYYHQIIPDSLVAVIFIAAVLYKVALKYTYNIPLNLVDSIIGLFGAGLLFILIAVVSNGGMGGGDIKLIAALGFILGWQQTILSILLSFVIGAIISIFLLLSKTKGRKDAIPFGPFINIAFGITLLWGDKLIDWYLKIFIL